LKVWPGLSLFPNQILHNKQKENGSHLPLFPPQGE
jgi:hypothetical protein